MPDLDAFTADELEALHRAIVDRMMRLVYAAHVADGQRPMMADDPELGDWPAA